MKNISLSDEEFSKLFDFLKDLEQCFIGDDINVSLHNEFADILDEPKKDTKEIQKNLKIIKNILNKMKKLK